MTTLATNLACTPVVAPFISNDKGDVSNKVRCSGAQFVNAAKTTGGLALVGGSTYALGKRAIYKPNSSFVKDFGGLVGKLSDKITGSKLGEAIKRLPKNSRMALAGLTVAMSLVAGVIVKNGIYEMGQIDQKYTDKAKIEENVKNTLA